LEDRPIEARRGAYLLTTDRTRIDPAAALALLAHEHWAADLRPATFARAMANSICFGLLDGERLIGFGRIVTDLATYAYWTDVVVDAAYRGQGLGRWLVDAMLAHPELQGLRRVALLTRDARGLYEQLGFTAELGPRTYMERRARPS
jgi:ribosomal protein S18 acetylase RimI-like enzyme